MNPTHDDAVRDPWRDIACVGTVFDLAGSVRERPYSQTQWALYKLSRERLVELLITAAGMIDLDQSLSQMLNWRDWPTCSRGHPQSPENVRLMEGRARVRRCRVCDRERKRRQRNEAV